MHISEQLMYLPILSANIPPVKPPMIPPMHQIDTITDQSKFIVEEDKAVSWWCMDEWFIKDSITCNISFREDIKYICECNSNKANGVTTIVNWFLTQIILHNVQWLCYVGPTGYNLQGTIVRHLTLWWVTFLAPSLNALPFSSSSKWDSHTGPLA